MSILALLLGGEPDHCNGAPTVSSLDNDTSVLNACGSNGWVSTWSLTAGALLSGQEFYFQYADNSAGDNWTFLERNTDGLITYQDGVIGSDGAFGSTTRYLKLRVYVVPTGGDDGDACSGPVTGSQINKTANACVS